MQMSFIKAVKVDAELSELLGAKNLKFIPIFTMIKNGNNIR